MFGLVVIRFLLGAKLRGTVFDRWSRCSLETFPKDPVVEFSWNAVFRREVEAAGFRLPVLRVMRRLQIPTGSELDLVWIESQSSHGDGRSKHRFQQRRCHGVEGPLTRCLDLEDICHGTCKEGVQVEVLCSEDVLDGAEH